MTARRPALTAIFGAGLSSPCGIATTAQITSSVTAIGTMVKATTPYRVVAAPGDDFQQNTEHINMTAMLWEALRATYQNPTFETYVHALETLEPFAASRRSPNIFHSIDDYRPIALAFMELLGRYEPFMYAGILRKERLDVIRRIFETIDADPQRQMFNPNAQAAREKLGLLLDMFAEHFDAAIVNLNYDDLVDQRLIDPFDGFSTPLSDGSHGFKASEFLDRDAHRGERPLMLHLHGSVRFGYHRDGSSSVVDIVKYPGREAALQSVRAELALPDAARGDTTHGGLIYANTPLVSGMQKADKLMQSPVPFGYYYHAAVDEILRSNRALIIGYSGGDPHLNAWLHEAARVHGEDYRLVFVTWLDPAWRGPITSSQRQMISNLLMPIEFEANGWGSSGPDGVIFGKRVAIVRSGFPLPAEHLDAVRQFLLG